MEDIIKSVRIPAMDLYKLKEIGKREDRTVSYMIRKAIENYLKQKI